MQNKTKNLLTEEQQEEDDETNLCKYFWNIFMEWHGSNNDFPI